MQSKVCACNEHACMPLFASAFIRSFCQQWKWSGSREAGGTQVPLWAYNEALVSPKMRWTRFMTRRSKWCQCAVLLCVMAPLGRNTQSAVTLMDRHGPLSFPGDFASSQLSSTAFLFTGAAGSSLLGTREHVSPEHTRSFSQSAGVTYDGNLLICACAVLHKKEIIAGGAFMVGFSISVIISVGNSTSLHRIRSAESWEYGTSLKIRGKKLYRVIMSNNIFLN